MPASTLPTDSGAATSTLSSEAYDLIQCFYDGVDRMVYSVAESIARKRSGVAAPHVVQIEEEDVRQAGEQVLAALRRAGAPDLLNAIGEMDDCMSSK